MEVRRESHGSTAILTTKVIVDQCLIWLPHVCVHLRRESMLSFKVDLYLLLGPVRHVEEWV